MNITGLLRKPIAGCLAVVLAAPIAEAATPPVQNGAGQADQSTATTVAQASNADQTANVPAPASSAPATPSAQGTSSTNEGTQTPNPQSGTNQDQSNPTKPLGTAAAPSEPVTGSAGSSLAGAAIAPAKQRRVRVILIRVGVVVGACVALGIVAALSRSSPSQPRQ
jgi:hypothetical protein